MSWYADTDIALAKALETVKEGLEEVEKCIKACENDKDSEYDTQTIRKAVERFKEDAL